MMTSRAEYRLMLRQDNADIRLTPIGHDIGLISDERYEKFLHKKQLIDDEVKRIKDTIIKPTDFVNEHLESLGSSKIISGVKLSDLLKRSELNYENLAKIDTNRKKLPDAVIEEAEIEIKYEGYIKLQLEQIEEFKKLEIKN